MGQLSVLESIALYLVAFGVPAYASTRLHCNRWLKIAMIMALPLLLATFRYNVGYDYGSYASHYQYTIDLDYSYFLKNYKMGDPIGFLLFAKWASSFGSERVFFFMLALVSLFPPMLYILDELEGSECLPMVVFMYLFDPFIFSFSAIKQGIAIGFLVYSQKYITSRRIIPYILCIALAFSFHFTAIVFLPAYFFINHNQTVSNLKRFAIIIGVLFAMVNIASILSSLNLADGRFGGYATNIVEGNNRTFWLYLFFAFIYILFNKTLISLDNRNELLIMLMIIGAMCQYLGFTNVFTKRIGDYFTFAHVFLLPQMLFVFNERSQNTVRKILYIYIFLIFMIGHKTASSGMGFVPYGYKFW